MMINIFKTVCEKIQPVREWSQARAIQATIRSSPDGKSLLIGPLRVPPGHTFIDLDIEIRVSWEQTRHYEFSKLYYSSDPSKNFCEKDCICFRLNRNAESQRVRLLLPESARAAGHVRLRLDALPYSEGVAKLHRFRLVPADDPDEELSTAAAWDALKSQTRAEVVESEASGRALLPHYPESLSVELQPGCNLTCPHCISHGTPEAHLHSNALNEMDSGMLAALAQEVFPHLTSFCMVGRGEPLLASDRLWNDLVGYLSRYRVLLTVMTNGYFIERRITEELLPFIDSLVVSVDGLNPATFAANRGGASFERVMAGIQHFNALRKRICLPRRPKLCISWTLKRNNIAEFPQFVRFIAPFEPDRFGVRHLMLYHDGQRDESLLNTPDLANRYLREAYGLLAEHGIETDCPPLFKLKPDTALPVAASAAGATAEPAAAMPADQDRGCIYIHRTGCLLAGGEMPTCGGPWADSAGNLASVPDFLSLWNGPRMQSVRRDLNTPNEWRQCRDCCYRQARYQAQRLDRAEGRPHPLTQLTSFSKKAWDFRTH